MSIEVRARSGWVPINRRPACTEDEVFELRGHARSAWVTLGGIPVELQHPVSRIRLTDHDDLRCHIGLLSLAVDGQTVGEIDVHPGKLTDERWRILRSELDSIWTGLILDDPAPTALEASGPDPVALWKRLGPVVADLAAHPVQTLGTHERWLRSERARSSSELTVSVALAGLRGQPGRARTIAAAIAEPERALVRDCLQRLQAYARRQRSGDAVAVMTGRFLARQPFAEPSRSSIAVTHLARHEPRLRQVVAVRQVLLNASSMITEGPGELRLGVKGLDKLYEYWVFLRVLKQLRTDFGEPLGAGFEQLAVRLPGGRLRLELAAGTTVEFPGGVHAVFSPRIAQNSRSSWRGLELAAHPSGTGIETPPYVEPDIVIQCDDASGDVVVIDAKYRARHLVDQALCEVHRKYGRFRQHGMGVVSEVIVAHPHESLELRWAGQRAVPFVPAGLAAADLWPRSWLSTAPSNPQEAASTVDSVLEAPDESKDNDLTEVAEIIEITEASLTPELHDHSLPARPATMPQQNAIPPSAPLMPAVVPRVPPPSPRTQVRPQDADLVICDQHWTASALRGRRLDLLVLRQLSSNGAPSYMIGSDHGQLTQFHDAAYHRGWNILVAKDRATFLRQVGDLLARLQPNVVTVISGYRDVLELTRAAGCNLDVLDDLTEMLMR